MAKLYVFGIGGTGSRTLRALTMLLASGVECKFDTIVPVIIDPDTSAADMSRTVDAMTRYMAIRKALNFNSANENRFFKTEICPIQDMDTFKLTLENTENVSFRDYMRTNQMDAPSKALINMLFSQANLDSDMVVGFKGNPNIGSVVLNQFSTSEKKTGSSSSVLFSVELVPVVSLFCSSPCATIKHPSTGTISKRPRLELLLSSLTSAWSRMMKVAWIRPLSIPRPNLLLPIMTGTSQVIIR